MEPEVAEEADVARISIAAKRRFVCRRRKRCRSDTMRVGRIAHGPPPFGEESVRRMAGGIRASSGKSQMKSVTVKRSSLHLRRIAGEGSRPIVIVEMVVDAK